MKLSVAFIFSCAAAFAQQSQDVALNTTVNTENTVLPAMKKLHNGLHQENVVKPITKQRELFMSTIGLQIAFLAVPKVENSYLSALSLPLAKIAFEAEGRPGVFEKVEYNTLVKIELLENSKGKPGAAIAGQEQLVIVTNKNANKQFDIKLIKETALPKDGYFVQLTIVGRCDAKGNLTHDRDFIAHKDKDGNEVKWMEYCQPNFPITVQPRGTLTFYKSPNKGNEWHTIDGPHLREIKDYPDYNIGFGYTTLTYK